jgi:hypothetical protein
MRVKLTIVLAFCIAFFLFSCQKKAQVEGISLEINFSKDTLSDNLITDMKYTWRTDTSYVKTDSEYKVYVHFWHKNNMLFQDDHLPEVATAQWEQENEYSYTRRIYIPKFIDEFDPQFKGEETLRLSIGLYSPYDRSGKSKKDVFEKKIKVLPPPLDTPEIIYEEGWYDQEINPEAFLKEWRWTAKEARCIVDNPHKDALLIIKGGVNLDAIKDQKIVFKINDMILDEFIAEDSYFEKSYNIKKEMLGEGDEFYLDFFTDKTFAPAEIIPNSKDERVLGMQVSFIYFR